MQSAIEFFVWMTGICALFLIAGAFAAIGEKIETMRQRRQSCQKGKNNDN